MPHIGEAEIVYDRLLQHIVHKEFWNEVVFFGSKDKYLNKASVKYLEHRLHDLALQAGRFKIEQNIPTRSGLSEAEEAELEEFLSNIKILTAALGHKIFEALEETIEVHQHKTQMFYCNNTAGAKAIGTRSTEGFIIYQGSLFMGQEQASLPPSYRNERKKMIEDGTLFSQGNLLLLTKDHIASSPSRAAAIVLARAASGPVEWKTEEGIQLKKFEE